MKKKSDKKITTSKKLGRPQADIDFELFEKLCSYHLTREEIAGVFSVTTETLNNNIKRQYGAVFSEVYKKHQAYGKMSLRRAQFRLAEKNAAMAIFLGKNYLGQSDKTSIAINEDDSVDFSRLDKEDLKLLDSLVEKAERLNNENLGSSESMD